MSDAAGAIAAPGFGPPHRPASSIEKTKAKLGSAIRKADLNLPLCPLATVSSRARVVPRPLTELDPETAKLIEDVTIDSKGRAVPADLNIGECVYSRNTICAECSRAVLRR
jgi:hypothetical protein